MLVFLWAVSVRAVAVLTAALAVGTVVASFQAVGTGSGTPPDQSLAAAPASEVPAEAQPLRPVRATAEPPSEPAVLASGAAPRYAAPKDAVPATRARPFSGSAQSSSRQVAKPLPNKVLTAVLDIGPAPTAEAATLAALVKSRLAAHGYDVSIVEGNSVVGSAPLRPNAFVSIRPVGSAGSGAGAQAWFCHVEGSLSGQLASLLLESLAQSGLPDLAEENDDVVAPDAFRCGHLLAGRASMPAALVQVPTFVEQDTKRQALAEALAGGLHRFLHRHRVALLRQEERRRLVWPALGPVTSHFDPGHPLGIDIGQFQGSVVAATDGVVLFAGGDPCCSYGLYVVIVGPKGLTTLYAHLESVAVRRGQRVRQGQDLGQVGCTGHCYGTHLHFEVIEGGVRRDPLSYLP